MLQSDWLMLYIEWNFFYWWLTDVVSTSPPLAKKPLGNNGCQHRTDGCACRRWNAIWGVDTKLIFVNLAISSFTLILTSLSSCYTLFYAALSSWNAFLTGGHSTPFSVTTIQDPKLHRDKPCSWCRYTS